MSVDLGIDLGTASVLVYVKGKGVVLKEPSVVAFDRDSNTIKAIGEEARLMLGRTPGNIIAVRPLRQGVISDYTVTEKMIKYFVQKSLGKRMFKKPRISICVPSGVTEVEKKAVQEATYAAGAREVHLIEEPVAAAIGAGIDISKACGNMIVDIGGGTADIAVISLGGTVVNTSIKIAGDDFDEAIVRFMRKKHNLLIGERTAEDIKIKIGTTYPLIEEEVMEVRGRNLVTGLPKTVTVTSSETEEALRETTGQIVEAAETFALFRAPRHPYTQGLIHSRPTSDYDGDRLQVIPGNVPSLNDKPAGCPFHPRCPYASKQCGEAFPPERVYPDGHRVSCWKYCNASEVQ